jgi:SAM-dependent methyltransferase
MPFTIKELQKAYLAYENFKKHHPSPHHDRYIFPFFAGSYFTYRKVDVLRIRQVAKSISSNPSYLDVGCGYGDFLNKIREEIPSAIGIEKESAIFFAFQKVRPDYIYSTAIEWMETKMFDIAFVGWMDPEVDFREFVSRTAKCIITTFDSGGQCGINGACEYDQFGFKKIAWWRTPSWIDVNTELMNRFYTLSLSKDEKKKEELSKLRTAHNLWYIYARPEISENIDKALKLWLEKETQAFATEKFDFESILDECGFHYMEELSNVSSNKNRLWEVYLTD